LTNDTTDDIISKEFVPKEATPTMTSIIWRINGRRSTAASNLVCGGLRRNSRRGLRSDVQIHDCVRFTFKETGDPNHFLYFHSKLKDDRHFSYPRNLFRPHGSHRDSRVGNRDKSKAKQSVEALKAVTSFLKEKGNKDE
jgi:hypothetical protein